MSVYLTIHNNTPYDNVRIELHDATRETERITSPSSRDDGIPLPSTYNDTTPLINTRDQQSYKLSESRHKKSGVRVLVIAGTSAHLHAYSTDFQESNTIYVESDGKVLLNNKESISSCSVSLEEYVNGVGIITSPSLAAYLERRLKGNSSECIIF